MLDASALLALILRERGYENVRPLLDECVLHAINASEVVSRLIRSGIAKADAVQTIEAADIGIVETFSFEMAVETGELIAKTRKLGLSLGDCACITAAAYAGATAVTAERAWKDLHGWRIAGNPVRIQVIR